MEGRRDATHACAAEAMGAAISDWTAEKCFRALSQELTPDEEQFHEGLALGRTSRNPRLRRISAHRGPLLTLAARSRGNRWGGNRMLRLVQVRMGYRDPDPQDGLVVTSGCVRFRSSHLQFKSLCDLKNGASGT